MTVFDLILAIPLLIGLVAGFRRGLLMEIIHLATFFVAIILGIVLLDQVSEWLSHYINDSKVIPVIAFVIIFIGTILLMTFVGKILKKILDMTLLGTADTILGAIFGLFKWAFIISVFFFISSWIGLPLREIFVASLLFGFIEPIAPFIFRIIAEFGPIGENFRELIEEFLP